MQYLRHSRYSMSMHFDVQILFNEIIRKVIVGHLYNGYNIAFIFHFIKCTTPVKIKRKNVTV